LFGVLAFPLINFVINLLAIINVFLFIRVDDTWRKFIKLVGDVTVSLIPFLSLLVIFTLMQSLILQYLGADYFNTKDYNEVPKTLSIAIQTMRNAIGDIKNPKYDEDAFTLSQKTMIWLVWSINVMISFIILNNFMINMISDKFENVKNQALENKYEDQCQLNIEYTVMKQNFLTKEESDKDMFNYIVIFSQQDLNGWMGISQEIKTHMDNMFVDLKKEFAKNKEQFMLQLNESKDFVITNLTEEVHRIVDEIAQDNGGFQEKSRQTQKEIDDIKKSARRLEKQVCGRQKWRDIQA